MVLTVSADRSAMPEGPQPATQIIVSSGSSAASVRVLVERAESPIVRLSRSPGPSECFRANSGMTWDVVAFDDSPPMTIAGRIVLGNGSMALPFAGSSGAWSATISPSALDQNGDGRPDLRNYAWTLTVADAFGNAAAVDRSFAVDPAC